MDSINFPWRSLKTRVTLFTLVIFLTSLWTLALYASQMLREDMQRMLGEQQASMVSFIAQSVNHELDVRLQGLERIAETVPPALMTDARSLQAFLDKRVVLQVLFNAGINIVGPDGIVIADAPLTAGRVGVNYADRDGVISALRDGKASIGDPVMGKKLKAPLFVMTAPIRNAQGKVIGALAGMTNLGTPNFLDKITGNAYGKTGGYLLVNPKQRQVVTATDKSRIMEVLPGPGINPFVDRHVHGTEGAAVGINSRGIEVLTSAKVIPVTGWQMVASLPTEEAFAPLHDKGRRLLLATALLTLLAGALTWWMLRHQLLPMFDAAKMLANLPHANQAMEPFVITRQDEIGELFAGFNRLLATLGQREKALQESEELFRKGFENANVGMCIVNTQGQLLKVNRHMCEIFGYSRAEMEVMHVNDIAHPDDRNLSTPFIRQAGDGQIDHAEFEKKYVHKDGRFIVGRVSSSLVRNSEGEPMCFVSHVVDITKQNRAEAELRIAAVAFESQEGMMITDAATTILKVNKAFTEITGYSAGEVIGQTPRMLSSGRHGPDFFRAIWETIGRTGSWQGEIWDRRKSGEHYPKWLTISSVKNAKGSVTHYVGSHYDITDRKLTEEKIAKLAFFDPLTHLPNRTLLLDRLKQAMMAGQRNSTCGAVLFIDLDHFKTLNDTLGHDKGDMLLKSVALRLSACVREGDTVARLGGDEFVIVLEGLSTNPEEAATQTRSVGEKILFVLNLPYLLGESEYHSSASLGATLFCGHEEAIDDLLKHADLAMYKSKETGRNSLRFFDPAMQTVVMERALLETGLRCAVEENQFLLHYQAQVVRGGQVTGAEVLVRWLHPVRGMVSPAEFIPLAEETGLILPLGQWVLHAACAQLALWALQPALAHLTIAVNVSAHQFREPDFVARVLATLRNTGASPRLLKLELTESLLVDNVEDIISKMVELKAWGVGFSLDDFGTGYSSLSYLKRLPLDQLKIDKSFVRDVLLDANDAAIATTIVALARSLGLSVIAEGVETAAQQDFLATSGCHAYQGYHFSKPVPVDKFEVFALQS